MPLDLPALLGRVYYRYPSYLIDAVTEHESGNRLVAVKNVTVGEEFFQGHFPGSPLMPAVLTIEALTQVAAVLVLDRAGAPLTARASLRGVDSAKFRRSVVPGDRLRLEVAMRRARSSLARVQAAAYVDDQVVAEAEMLLAIESARRPVDPTAHVDPAAQIGEGTIIGPHAMIGPEVRIGKHCRIGASASSTDARTSATKPRSFRWRRSGWRRRTSSTEASRPGCASGGGTSSANSSRSTAALPAAAVRRRSADDNLFMAYVHVAHDCHVGSGTIFGPHATLGGHVGVEDFANVSAGSAVHQFCRVGRYGFIGGYSVVTKDALPFGRTIGSRPARVFGVNSIGLSRRGFTPDTIAQLKLAYRYLLQSKLNTTQALAQIEQDESLSAPEVRYLVEFIRTSQRGVILRRPTRRAEELVADE